MNNNRRPIEKLVPEDELFKQNDNTNRQNTELRNQIKMLKKKPRKNPGEICIGIIVIIMILAIIVTFILFLAMVIYMISSLF